MTDLSSFEENSLAAVFGAGGGIGSALVEALLASGRFSSVLAFSRSSEPPVDLTDEACISAAARTIEETGMPLRLVIDATGFLHEERYQPEKSFKHLRPDHMAYAFQINATGPALLMKYCLPLLPREKKSVFASLSAKVGSIGDNAIGGWYSYRASKAALNQLIRCAAIEVARQKKDAIVCALHPGTVETRLSEPFSKQGLNVRTPAVAAKDILSVIEFIESNNTGDFISYDKNIIPW